MDAGTVVMIVLASIIILAAIAIIAQAITNNRRASAEAYSTRMNANAAIVSRMVGRTDHAIDIDSDGILTVTPREFVPTQSAESPQPVIDATAHDDAVALIDATMTHPNPKRKPGQLMTADECQQYGVLGGDRTRRQGAVDYLCKFYDVQAESGAGPTRNGVYYRANGGDLSRLILDMAIKGIPYPAQRPPAAA